MLHTGDMILYIENPKDSTQKLLKMINEFNHIAGYKINIQKSLHFFILIMKYHKGKVFKNPFKIASKINK